MKSYIIFVFTFFTISSSCFTQWLHYDKAKDPNDSNLVIGFARSIVVLKNGDTFYASGMGLFKLSNGLWEKCLPDSLHSFFSITNILKDSKDNIWIACTEGVMYYDTKLKKVTQSFNGRAWAIDSTQPPVDLSYNSVKCIAIDSSDGLWLSGFSNATDLAHFKDGIWTKHPIFTKEEFYNYWPIGEGGSACLEVAKDGCLWYSSYTHLVRFDPKTNIRTGWDTLKIDNKIVTFIYQGRIHIAHDGKIWLNAQTDYILTFSPKDSIWNVFDRKDIPNVRPQDAVNTIFAQSVTEDSKRNIWMTVAPDYLLKYDITIKKWKRLQLPDGKNANQGVKTFILYGLAVDSKDRVWVGTLGEGVFVYTGDATDIKETNEIEGDIYAHTWIFSVVPNPVTKRSSVQLFADPGLRSSFHVGLYSMQGIEVRDLTSVAQIDWTTGHGTVDLISSNLSSGMYLFRVSNGADNYVSLVTVIQ
ncbi:MAG: hypothetical protein HYZ54_05250 [Ignavibacteriae bacterium]|nr:hypothetical protein [Ignavibacteriota bacterium]